MHRTKSATGADSPPWCRAPPASARRAWRRGSWQRNPFDVGQNAIDACRVDDPTQVHRLVLYSGLEVERLHVVDALERHVSVDRPVLDAVVEIVHRLEIPFSP